MGAFDQLVEHLFGTYDDLLRAEFPLSSDARQLWTHPDRLDWLAVGGEQESLYLNYACGEPTRSSDRRGYLVPLIERGLGDEESKAFHIAGYEVVDFDAADYEDDFWGGRDFILQCAMPFVALRLGDSAASYAIEPGDGFEVGVFADIEDNALQAYAPTYYLDMPEDVFLSELDSHCDEPRYVSYVQHLLEGGWSGDAIELARSVLAE